MERNIRLLGLFNFFTDFILFAPVAIIYFSNVTGSYTLGMSIFSTVMISAAILEIPTGIFSDFIGRKNTIILGAAAATASIIFYAIGHSYLMLFVGALFEGLSRAFFSGNNDALLHDSLTQLKQQDKFHTFLGKTNSLSQVALAVAALLGGVIAQWSFTAVLWISVLPKLCALIIAFLFENPKHQGNASGNIFHQLQQSFAQFQANKKLRFLTYTSIIKFALGESAYQFRSVFVASLWPLWAIGLSNTLSNIGASVSYYYSGKVIDTLTPKRVLIFEILYNRTVNILALLFPTVLSPLLMSTTSLSYGVGSVATSMLLQKEFTQQQRATLGSLGSFASSIAFAICAIILGKIGDMYGPIYALLCIHILLFAPLWFYKKIFYSTHT